MEETYFILLYICEISPQDAFSINSKLLVSFNIAPCKKKHPRSSIFKKRVIVRLWSHDLGVNKSMLFLKSTVS